MVSRTRPNAPRRRGRPRFYTKRRVCAFCVEHVSSIDYKDVSRLRRYISERARMDPRRKTGTCAKHQRPLAQAIKRARHVALLPFTQGQMRTDRD
jgi:small subunit ribosomal protein S18